MNIITTPLSGVFVAETIPYSDERGQFFRAFCRQELSTVIGERQIVQANVSRTHAVGAIRGLHYQNSPHAEMKLIRCLYGKVWDVAVDLRKGSPTFLNWFGTELNSENLKMLIIPEGCAHGFQVLEKNSELLYMHTMCYSLESEGGVRFDDPSLAINWPLPVTDISERDKHHPLITSSFDGALS